VPWDGVQLPLEQARECRGSKKYIQPLRLFFLVF